jgi:glycosyltransferase involved in cell wall biosynthesis
MKLRIALIISHPIQHFCPQYVSFAQNPKIEIKVFFASMLGYKKYIDPDFKQEISWGNLELDKFQHEFLNGNKVIPAGKNLDAVSLDDGLDNFEPAVIITYGYFQKLQRRAHAWGKRKKVPIAYISDSESRQHRNWLKEQLKYPFIRKYFSEISFFLSVGEANEEYYRHYGVSSDKIIRMHFPIDVTQYRVAYEQRIILRQSVREQYGLTEQDIVLTVAGKLVSWKNQDHIIAAMKLLETENVYTHLFVLGSGERMEELQKKASALAKSKVHFCGFVPIDQLPAFYSATDIYVHPASVEPHSIAVSEAIYMGCSVIISDRCGSYGKGDDVQEGINGLVYPFGDIDKLAQKIKWMTNHPLERKQFGINSHTIALDFQQRSHVEILNELIKKLNI